MAAHRATIGDRFAAAQDAWYRLARRMRPVTQEDRNERLLYVEVSFQAIIEAGVMSFMSVFLVRLGAPNWLVGLYSSLPALVMSLAILPIGTMIQGNTSLVKAANWGRGIFRGGIALFSLLPFLPAAAASYAMVGFRSLLNVAAAASNVAFTTILGMATSPGRRPRMISTRLAVNGLAGAAAGLAAGAWLNGHAFPMNYQLLFLVVGVAGAGSMYMLSKIKLPDMSERTPRARKGMDLGRLVDVLRTDKMFRNYCLAIFVYRLSMSMPSALYSIYKVRVLGASDSWIGITLTVERLISVVTYFAMAQVLSRPRNRRWLWMTLLGVALYPITTAMARTPEMLLIPAICGGLFGAGANIFLTNVLFQVSPEDQRPTYVSIDSFLANINAFVAPMMGTALADGISLVAALSIIGGLRLLGGLAFWRLGVGLKEE